MRLIERTISVDVIFRAENKEINTARARARPLNRAAKASAKTRYERKSVRTERSQTNGEEGENAKWKKEGTKAFDVANKQEIKM